MLTLELITGASPFLTTEEEPDSHARKLAIKKRILNVDPLCIADPHKQLSPDVRDLLARLLMKDPARRLTKVSEIKAHPFFRGIDWVKLAARKIEPPFRPEISSDTDVSNFDSEFTSLPLDFSEARSDSEDNAAQDNTFLIDELCAEFSFIAPDLIESSSSNGLLFFYLHFQLMLKDTVSCSILIRI